MIIAVSNPKGGAGKSTSSLLLATYLAEHGASVSVVDADPRQPIVYWKGRAGTSSTVEVVGGIKENTLMDALDKLNHQFVFIDLEGTASVLVSRSIALADFVIIPVQASPEDVRAAGTAIRAVVDEEKMVKRANPERRIPYKVLLTRTPAPGAPVSWLQRQLEAEIASAQLPRFRSSMAERQAFKVMFLEGLTLRELSEKGFKVGNIDAAYQNVHEVATELINYLEGKEAPSEELEGAGVIHE
jgi:chromosome partitioning protein